MAELNQDGTTGVRGNGVKAPDLAALLTAVFRGWDEANVNFLVLRNYEDLPSATGNDVDVLILPEQLGLAEKTLLQAAGSCGYVLHNRAEFACVGCYLFHPDSLEQIQIDLNTGIKWHSFELASAGSVLRRRRRRDLFWIPDPLDEAILNLLNRLIYEGKVKEKYKPGILQNLSAKPNQAEALLAPLFGGALARELLQRVLQQDWNFVERAWKKLRRKLVLRRLLLRPWHTLRSLVSDAFRLLRRWLAPPGIVLAVLGPDGSGKSTVAALAVQRLRRTFHPGRGVEVHWKPVVFLRGRRRPSGKPNLTPHAKVPRGRLASLIYLVFHWFEFMAGSHLIFRHAQARNGLVLIDRYFYDFLVDQRRYRLQVPPWCVKLIYSTVKSPDLVLLYDAPADVLQSRKQEVTLAETERQVRAYRTLIAGLPQGKVIDASKPIETVTEDTVRLILFYMRERQSRRLRLASHCRA